MGRLLENVKAKSKHGKRSKGHSKGGTGHSKGGKGGAASLRSVTSPADLLDNSSDSAVAAPATIGAPPDATDAKNVTPQPHSARLLQNGKAKSRHADYTPLASAEQSPPGAGVGLAATVNMPSKQIGNRSDSTVAAPSTTAARLNAGRAQMGRLLENVKAKSKHEKRVKGHSKSRKGHSKGGKGGAAALGSVKSLERGAGTARAARAAVKSLERAVSPPDSPSRRAVGSPSLLVTAQEVDMLEEKKADAEEGHSQTDPYMAG